MGLKGNQKKGNDGKFVANPVLKPTRALSSMTPSGDIARINGNWWEVEEVAPASPKMTVMSLDGEVIVDTGVIDDNAYSAYKRGQCFALAAALAERVEEGRVGVLLEAFETSQEAGDVLEYDDPELTLDLDHDWFNYVRHAVAIDANGNGVDIEGPNDINTLIADQCEFAGGDVVMVTMTPSQLNRILNRTSVSVEQNHQAAAHMANTVVKTYEYGYEKEVA